MPQRMTYAAGAAAVVVGAAIWAAGSSALAGPDAVPTQAPATAQANPAVGTPSPRGPAVPKPGSSIGPVALDPGPATRPTGAPAIRLNAANSSAGPAYGAREVEDYVRARPTTLRDDPNAPVAIDRIEFLPSASVAARLRASTGRADDETLCLVTLRGAFSAGRPGLARTRSTTAFQVFDARTGNLLMEGLG